MPVSEYELSILDVIFLVNPECYIDQQRNRDEPE